MVKKSPAVTKTLVEELTYEQAYAELEGIVVLLEQEQTDLEATIAWFERGQALAKQCQNLLDQAELRVRTLGIDSTGSELDTAE
jgi:exodeoxyribonuclease VII small subunit